MTRLPSQRGFTLLEVLMALAILAGTGIAILGVTGEIIRQTPVLEQRTLARMVADNQMTDLMLSEKLPSESGEWAEQEFANKKWPIRFRRIRTAYDNFVAFEVVVYEKKDQDSPQLASLTGYKVASESVSIPSSQGFTLLEMILAIAIFASTV